jgi:biotin carboxylase
MQDALQKYKISGVKTNIPLHQQVLDFYLFQNGIFNTDFLSNYIHMKPHERLITDNLPDAHYCFI